MSANPYFWLAIFVLAAHLLFNLWVIFGAVLTRKRPVLAAAHILSVIYGAAIQNSPWPCPLTIAETWCEARAGMVPYQGPFLLHYLDTFVYPNIPLWLLRLGAIVVLLVNVGIYVRRARQGHVWGTGRREERKVGSGRGR